MLENLTKKQKNILIIIAIIVAIGIICFIYKGNGNKNNIDVNEEILVASSKENKESEEDIVIVHITGCVKTPGIVKLKVGSRVEDAINSAGGLTDEADISAINLAYVLEDGTKIKIPSVWDGEENEKNIITDDIGDDILEQNSSKKNTKTININKATEAELLSLPGIGPSLAGKIIEYREQNGKFKSIENIQEVNGIGSSKFENIKDFISV